MSQKRKTKEQQIFSYLKETLGKLPTDAVREELLGNIELINNHILDLRKRIESLPNDLRKGELIRAINLIDSFLSSAKDNPSVAAALGLPYKRTAVARMRVALDLQIGERLFKELSPLPTEEIQRRLLDYKTVSMDGLRALAAHIGIKHQQRVKRLDLVDQIVKLGFANIRGYEKLRSPDNMHIKRE